MVQPKLSDLYNRRQIAKIWFRSLIGGAVLQALVGSQLFTTRTAWADPVAWVQFIVSAVAGIFLVLKALSTDDYREMPPVSVEGIPTVPREKP